MKKVFWKKLTTVLIATLAVALMFVAAYGIGFQFKSDALGKLTLDDLKNSTTYDLMLSGIILSAISVGLLLISTIFGRLLFAFDQILWGGGIFVLVVGFILLVAGEGYFAAKTDHFTDIFNQGMFAAMIICSVVPGLIGVGMGAASFQKRSRLKNI